MWRTNEQGERVLQVGELVTAVVVPVGGVWVLQARLADNTLGAFATPSEAEQGALVALSTWANDVADRVDDLLIEAEYEYFGDMDSEEKIW